MKKYIDLEKLEKNLEVELENSTDYRDAIDFAIEDTPIEDVAPVVHAHWIADEESDENTCSHCGGIVDFGDAKTYCQYCGAKMDEGGEAK